MSALITVTKEGSAGIETPAVHSSVFCATITEVDPTEIEVPFVQTVEDSSPALVTMAGASIAATEVPVDHIPAASHVIGEGISEPGSVEIVEGIVTLSGCDELPEVVAEVPSLVVPTLFFSAMVSQQLRVASHLISCQFCVSKLFV